VTKRKVLVALELVGQQILPREYDVPGYALLARCCRHDVRSGTSSTVGGMSAVNRA